MEELVRRVQVAASWRELGAMVEKLGRAGDMSLGDRCAFEVSLTRYQLAMPAMVRVEFGVACFGGQPHEIRRAYEQ